MTRRQLIAVSWIPLAVAVVISWWLSYLWAYWWAGLPHADETTTAITMSVGPISIGVPLGYLGGFISGTLLARGLHGNGE